MCLALTLNRNEISNFTFENDIIMSNAIVIVKYILQVCISLDTEINFERELGQKDKNQ